MNVATIQGRAQQGGRYMRGHLFHLTESEQLAATSLGVCELSSAWGVDFPSLAVGPHCFPKKDYFCTSVV